MISFHGREVSDCGTINEGYCDKESVLVHTTVDTASHRQDFVGLNNKDIRLLTVEPIVSNLSEIGVNESGNDLCNSANGDEISRSAVENRTNLSLRVTENFSTGALLRRRTAIKNPDQYSANQTNVLQKRKYNMVSGTPGRKGPSSMRQSWIMDSVKHNVVLQLLWCCRPLRCFQNANYAYLMDKISYIQNLSISSKTEMLLSILKSKGYVLFDGIPVCSIFLKEAFRFSRDQQAKVGSNL